jgi:uncharacterized protein (TIGR03000 family)
VESLIRFSVKPPRARRVLACKGESPMKRVTHVLRAGFAVVFLLAWGPRSWGQAEVKPATLVVQVAADARLEIEGDKTQQTGEVRRFQSPPLAVDRDYTYTFRATWIQAGKELQAERKVRLRGGQTVDVDLRTPDQPSERLFTLEKVAPVVVAQGESDKLTVRIRRQGFQGPVKLTFRTASSSLRFAETTIPAGEESAEVEVTAAKATAVGTWTAWIWATAGNRNDFDVTRVMVTKGPALNLLGIPSVVRLSRGSKKSIAFEVWRDALEGPVTVKFDGLPAGVQIPEVTVPADKKQAEIVATAGDDLPVGTVKEVRVLASAGRLRVVSPARIVIEPPPHLIVEFYLGKGQLAEKDAALLERLKEGPRDDQARFALGALQFVRAIEHLGQSLYRLGVHSETGQQANIPFLRLPVPTNPQPEECTYSALREVFEELIADLHTAEATLAKVQDKQVKLALHPGAIRLDFVGDGKSHIRFGTILKRYVAGARTLEQDEDLLIVFDRGDVAWLRGYCHLLMALAEIFLAYDVQELFDIFGHAFFTKVKTVQTLRQEDILLLYNPKLPLKEPKRMKAALNHLEQVMALGKESWKFILAETDDDHEWIPNPKQRGALGIRVSQPMVDSWLAFVDEVEALLAGKRLIPSWRGGDQRGINLRRVFLEPRPLDLGGWIDGTVANPYLEEGPLTRPAVWNQLQRVFGGDLLNFAIWFN